MNATDLAARLALASLAGLGPARGAWLLAAATPEAVVDDLRSGRLPPVTSPPPPGVTERLVLGWGRKLRSTDPGRLLAAATADAVELVAPTDDDWPFADEEHPPLLLFVVGDRSLLAAPARVAIVGTRRCTSIGRAVATDLGAGVAAAGVTVVSGLAAGIDAAAHRGALAAGGPALGVVGTGLDVVYPRANRALWGAVAEGGLLVSEAPPGTKPERWRFPARNRLIASLALAVVVVESHAEGGSLITVDEAIDRSRTVLAVPGAVTSPASVGTNRLLLDGCPPVCDPGDVLDAIGHPRPTPGAAAAAADVGRPARAATVIGPLGQRILDEVAAGSGHLDGLAVATGASVPVLLAEVDRLVRERVLVLDGSTVSRPPDGRPA
ncbi:MAG: DNA-processing protein DprA [Acidimicrobiales bacterium]